MQQGPHKNASYNTQSNPDEIDLIEVFSALKQNIKVIISITTSFACFSLIYALSITPIYEATAIITKPTKSELFKIDQGINLLKLNPHEELKRIHLALINQDLQYQFFTDHVYEALPSNPTSPHSAYESF